MRRAIRIDENNWARCGNCGHKLFRIGINQEEQDAKISMKVLKVEIKCHSCKIINVLEGGYDD